LSVALGYREGGRPAGPYADGLVTGEATQWKASAFPQGAPAGVSRIYTYDKFGRLRDAKASRPAQDLALHCDANSNILAFAAGGKAAAAYAYEAGTDQLTEIAPPAGPALPVTHGRDGAVASLGATRLSHDGPGGRASGVRTAAEFLAYQASADGERVLKRVAGQEALTRLTIRSGAATLLELDSEGHEEIHVQGPAGLIALIVDGQDHAVSRDQRGSTRAVWTGDTATAAFDYDPFGAIDEVNSRLADKLAACIRRRYTGQEWEEEIGLYNYHARLYDPVLARFLSPDPAGEGASPYAYVGNDPVNFVDPTGGNVERLVRAGDWVYFLDRKNRIVNIISYHADAGRIWGKYRVSYSRIKNEEYSKSMNIDEPRFFKLLKEMTTINNLNKELPDVEDLALARKRNKWLYMFDNGKYLRDRDWPGWRELPQPESFAIGNASTYSAKVSADVPIISNHANPLPLPPRSDLEIRSSTMDSPQ
jgi:RHS repeat-associated protein